MLRKHSGDDESICAVADVEVGAIRRRIRFAERQINFCRRSFDAALKPLREVDLINVARGDVLLGAEHGAAVGVTGEVGVKGRDGVLEYWSVGVVGNGAVRMRNLPSLSLGVIEDEQVVVKTEPAIRQAHVVLCVGRKLFDEVFQVIAKVADGRADGKISRGGVPMCRELFLQHIKRVAAQTCHAFGRDDFN